MGVPQRRRRVFFIALRKDLATPFMEAVDMFQTAPKLDLEFNESEIVLAEFTDENQTGKKLSEKIQIIYNNRKPSDTCLGNIAERMGKRKYFNQMINYLSKSSYTVTGSADNLILNGRYLNDYELKMIGSYPKDYNFGKNKVQYLVGMSVPPVMVAQIATEIFNQWISKL